MVGLVLADPVPQGLRVHVQLPRQLRDQPASDPTADTTAPRAHAAPPGTSSSLPLKTSFLQVSKIKPGSEVSGKPGEAQLVTPIRSDADIQSFRGLPPSATAPMLVDDRRALGAAPGRPLHLCSREFLCDSAAHGPGILLAFISRTTAAPYLGEGGNRGFPDNQGDGKATNTGSQLLVFQRRHGSYAAVVGVPQRAAEDSRDSPLFRGGIHDHEACAIPPKWNANHCCD